MELDRRDFLKASSYLTFTIAAGGCATAAAPKATAPAAPPPVAGAAPTAGKVHVHWLGQSATKLTSPTGKVIVIDPFIRDNPKTPEAWKDLDKLGSVDVVLVTHGHRDHTSDVMELQKRTGAAVAGPAGLMQTMVDLGWLSSDKALRFSQGGRVNPIGPRITITMVHAEHSSELTVIDPVTKKSTTYPGGEPAGFIVEFENGFKVYHMGDTGIFGDLRLIGDYYKPDLIMIPIGGHFVMDPRDAAYVTNRFLVPKYAIPIHYATFPVLRGTPQEYKQHLGETTTQMLPLDPGDMLTF